MSPPFQVVCADRALQDFKIYWGEIYTVERVSPSEYNPKEFDLFYLQDDGRMTTNGGHWRKRFRDLETMQNENFISLTKKEIER
jgi:hypothetical protein